MYRGEQNGSLFSKWFIRPKLLKQNSSGLELDDHSSHDHSEGAAPLKPKSLDDAYSKYDLCEPGPDGHGIHSQMNYPEFAGVVVMLASIILYWGFKRKVPQLRSRWRVDIVEVFKIEKLLQWRYFSITLRSISAAIFSFIVLTGLIGNPHTSIAASFTWLIWWTLLIFFIAFAGKIYCAACPWEFFADLFQFGLKKNSAGEKKSLQKKWPKFMRNIYPATALFVVITWLELGFHLTSDSYLTAVLGLMVVFAVVLSAQTFERRSFCRFACPIGRISGVYAQCSPIELRVKEKDVCKTCKGHECVRGSERGTSCPTFQVPHKLNQNTYCTLCTECVRNCPDDNLTLLARPINEDLGNLRHTRRDEGLLVIVVIVLTFFHGLTMTPMWLEWTSATGELFDINFLGAFTLLMALIMLGFFFGISVADVIIRRVAGLKQLPLAHIFAFIPLVLFYHLGHNGMHLLSEGPRLIPMLGDPFGWGWNLLNLSNFEPTPLLSHGTLHYLQLLFIVIGFYLSCKVLSLRVVQTPNIPYSKTKFLYWSYGAVLFSLGVLAVWFVHQPMVMRVAM